MALAAVKVTKERKQKIPEHICLVGFDDIKAISHTEPLLSTIRQPLYKVGETAAKLLFQLLNNKGSKSQKIILDTKPVIRESCGAL